MPDNEIVFTEDDGIEEAVDNTPETQKEEETSFAENNEDEESSESPAKGEADETTLEKEAKSNARTSRRLGEVASHSSKFLFKSALNGDDEAISEIKSNKELKEYFKKKNPDGFKELFENNKEETEVVTESVETADDIAKKAVQILKQEEDDKEIHSFVKNTGIKGEDSYNQIVELSKKFADDFGKEKAVALAYEKVTGKTPAPVSMPRSVNSSSSGVTRQTIQMSTVRSIANKHGISEEQAKEVAKRMKAMGHL